MDHFRLPVDCNAKSGNYHQTVDRFEFSTKKVVFKVEHLYNEEVLTFLALQSVIQLNKSSKRQLIQRFSSKDLVAKSQTLKPQSEILFLYFFFSKCDIFTFDSPKC